MIKILYTLLGRRVEKTITVIRTSSKEKERENVAGEGQGQGRDPVIGTGGRDRVTSVQGHAIVIVTAADRIKRDKGWSCVDIAVRMKLET